MKDSMRLFMTACIFVTANTVAQTDTTLRTNSPASPTTTDSVRQNKAVPLQRSETGTLPTNPKGSTRPKPTGTIHHNNPDSMRIINNNSINQSNQETQQRNGTRIDSVPSNRSYNDRHNQINSPADTSRRINTPTISRDTIN